MTRPGIEPRSSRPLANTLTIMPMAEYNYMVLNILINTIKQIYLTSRWDPNIQPFQVREGQGVMAKNRYFTASGAAGLKLHYQMSFRVGPYPLSKGCNLHILSPATNMADINFCKYLERNDIDKDKGFKIYLNLYQQDLAKELNQMSYDIHY